jgi:hypothetical protein
MTAPALKINQLLDRLRVLLDTRSCDELELRRLRQDLKRQIALYTHDGDAFMALGIIERLAGHEEEAVRHHEAALHCGWTPDRALNYTVTLADFYRYDEALQQAQDVVNNDPTNLGALRAAAHLAFITGRFRLEKNLLAEYVKRVPGQQLPDDLAKIDTAANLIVSTVEQLDLADDLLAAFHRPLWELLRTIGWGQDIHITDQVFGDGGDRFISRTLRLPLSFESAQALNWQWVERLAEQDECWPMEKMMITLREAA